MFVSYHEIFIVEEISVVAFSMNMIPAIIVATIFNMALGAFWYSPMLFGPLWAKQLGLNLEQISPNKKQYVLALVVALVTSWILAYLVEITHSTTAYSGGTIGFICWLGFIATTHLSGVIWAKKPLIVYFIDVSCLLVVLTLNGAIVATFR